MMTGRTVKLAVHAVAALAGHEGERRVLGGSGDAFGRLEEARMPLAVVIAVARDLRRVELDETLSVESALAFVLAEGLEAT